MEISNRSVLALYDSDFCRQMLLATNPGPDRDTLSVSEEVTVSPESFRELCARAQKETDIETVGEIVDRPLAKR
jgi:hypothetical protein